jgi:hypothetical protein
MKPREPERRPSQIQVEPRSTRRSRLWDVDIYLLAGLPVLASILLLVFGLFVSRWLYGQGTGGPLIGPISSAACLVASLGGVAQVWRREAPGPVGGPVHGGCAVVSGWIWAITLWVAAIAALIVL